MLSLIGFIAIIVITIQVYKTARSTERNAALWATFAAALGIVLQFVIPIALTAALTVYYLMTGTTAEKIEDELLWPASLIGIAGVVLSIIGMVLIMKHVAKVVDDGTSAQSPPPPPPMFDRQS